MKNDTGSSLSEFQIKFKPNSFGLNPISADIPLTLNNGDVGGYDITCDTGVNSSKEAPECPLSIDVAVKCNIDVYVFSVPLMFSTLFVKTSTLVNNVEMMNSWTDIPDDPSQTYHIKALSANLKNPFMVSLNPRSKTVS